VVIIVQKGKGGLETGMQRIHQSLIDCQGESVEAEKATGMSIGESIRTMSNRSMERMADRASLCSRSIDVNNTIPGTGKSATPCVSPASVAL
jgi:hypothetical protein